MGKFSTQLSQPIICQDQALPNKATGVLVTSNISLENSCSVFPELLCALDDLFENSVSPIADQKILKSRDERYDERSNQHQPPVVRRIRHN